MKKTTLTEEPFDYPPLLDEDDLEFRNLTVHQPEILQNNSTSADSVFLDKILAAVKWIFLYLPGAAAIHFMMLGGGLLVLYQDWGAEMFLGTLGAFAVSTFMVMLGINKLNDLKYLKVVAAIALTGLLTAILFVLVTVITTGDVFGLFAKTTLPLSVLVGFRVKKIIDEQSDDD